MIRSITVGTALAALAMLSACGQEQAAAPEAPAPQAAAEQPAPAPAPAASMVPDYVSAAVADPNRPAEQRDVDALRMPAETVAFSGMQPGDVVVDYRPGGGYYTRIFSRVVGAEGKVYVAESAERVEGRADRLEGLQALASDPNYANVEVATPPFAALDQIGEPVDIVWTSANYHDMVNAETAEGLRPFNESVFRALRPGGLYFILDHASAPGAGYTTTESLHRIDPEVIKQEMAAVGFVFEGESNVLIRPEDDRTTHSSFSTSQFMLKFRKPE
jgi:predicted methyltransferase